MNKKSIILLVIMTAVITFGVSISAQSLIAAWQNPGAAAPGGNVSAPVNVGSDAQTKAGSLKINGVLDANGGFIVDRSPAVPTGVVNGQMWLQY